MPLEPTVDGVIARRVKLQETCVHREFRPVFDTQLYLDSHPDVAAHGINPEEHYLLFGWREGRNPNNYAKSLIVQAKLGLDSTDPDGGIKIMEAISRDPDGFRADVLGHWREDVCSFAFLDDQTKRFLLDCLEVDRSGLFDPAWFFDQTRISVEDALEFFVRHGHRSLVDPSKRFSTTLYLKNNPAAAAAGVPALVHHLRHQVFANTSRAPNVGAPIGKLDNPGLTQNRNKFCEDIKSRIEVEAPASTVLPFVIKRPAISILTPVYNVDPIWLDQMVSSVRNQTSYDWELILVDDCSTYPRLKDRLRYYASIDRRIHAHFLAKNSGISEATNAALRHARGDYIGLLDNDDILTVDAVQVVLDAIAANQQPDMLYSDEFKVDESNRPSSLFAKPAWSPTMLLNYMYTGHFSVYRRSLVEEIGGFRSEFDFSQDYDLALRVSEVAKKIVHVQAFIYGWRAIQTSSAAGGKPLARLTNVAALQDAIDRRGWNGQAVGLPTANKIEFRRDVVRPKVSIVVPSDNLQNIGDTLLAILLQTVYGSFEIVIVTRTEIGERVALLTKDPRVRVCPYDGPYNFSDKCNAGASVSTGQFLVFFNDDVRPRSTTWLDGLVDYLMLNGVGAVGPKLLYENGAIQHAGMTYGVRNIVGTMFHSLPADTAVHFNFAQCAREVNILSGALFAVNTAAFKEVGGFDAINAPIMHSDVDISLRLTEAGHRLIYTPHVEMTHIGHLSLRESEEHDFARPSKAKNKADIHQLKRFGHRLNEDTFFTATMRELLYHDSAENFVIHAPASNNSNHLSDVLLVSHDLTASGAPRILCEIAETLSEVGHFVVVVSPHDGPMRDRLTSAGVIVIIDACAEQHPDALSSLARNFDHVLCNTIVMWRVVQRLVDHESLTWYIHEGEYIDDLANQFGELSTLLRSFPRIQAVSPHTGAILEKHGCRYQVLSTGVNAPENVGHHRAACKKHPLKFGVFGSYEVRKGQDIAAHAFSILPADVAEMVELHMYGRSHDAHFEREIRRIYAGSPNIFFHAALPQNEYEKMISHLDVIIVPSRDDPLPLVSLDALAHAKPLLCSSTVGTTHFLKHGTSALIATDNSGQCMASLITHLVDREIREALAFGGRQVFEAEFTKAAFLGRVRRLFGAHA